MVLVPHAVEVSVMPVPVPVSQGDAVTVVVKRMVRWPVSAEVDALEVATGVSVVVSVANKQSLMARLDSWSFFDRFDA